MNLKQVIKKKLNNLAAVAVLGVGSELRGDDVAGMLVAETLQKSASKINKRIKFKVFLGGTAPENFTGGIKEFKPTHLIIVDSAETGKRAGTITVFDPEETVGISFSTHSLPLKVMSDYLSSDINCVIIIIGIQPKSLKFGQLPTREVRQAVERVSQALEEILYCKPRREVVK